MSAAFALDTSCVIALLSSWHEFHVRTRQSFEERHSRGERLVIPASVLLESFSVLTRMPVRLAPEDAQRILWESFHENAEIAVLAGDAAWRAIGDSSQRMGGGIIYDAAIARAAHDAGARVLLTWKTRDFVRVGQPGLEIRQP